MLPQFGIRRRVFYTVLCGSAAALTLLPLRWAIADPPDILRNYRFITDKSTVEVTGGFAGIDWSLNILGGFGLVTGYNYSFGGPTGHVPTLDPFAQFIDVKAILFDPRRASPMPSPGWDLDHTLNLSGLDGTFTVPSQLQFSGVDGQDQPIELKATLVGSLLHLVGANDPGCCDFFNYKVDAYAHLLPWADFNSDGRVDGDDFAIWRQHYGSSVTPGEDGDANGDGLVDAEDYTAWRSQLGQPVDGASIAGAVPEPGTTVLVVAGLAILITCLRWV